MSREYASPLVVNIRSSAILRSYLILIYLLAITAVFYSGISLWLRFTLVALVVVSFYFSMKKQHRYKQFTWMPQNQWQLITNDNEYINATLTPMSFSVNWLVILALRSEAGKRINLVLPKDATEAEMFRKLKVKLTLLKPSYFKSPEESKL